MPDDEYSAVGGGGKLKLKGSKVSEGRVEKKKNKKKKNKDKNSSQGENGNRPEQERIGSDADVNAAVTRKEKEGSVLSGGEGGEEADTPGDEGQVKTEAERKYEEAKRKRVRISFPPSGTRMGT